MLISLSNDSMFRKLTNYTYKLVDKLIIPILFPIIVDLKKLDNPYWAGEFSGRYNAIYISDDYWLRNNTDAKLKGVIHTLCHEIGHAIYFNYLANKPQYLPRKDPNWLWAHYNKNGNENFAECFADYCMATFDGEKERISNSKRLDKMRAILEKVKIEGCKIVTINEAGEFYVDKQTTRKSINRLRNIYVERNVSYPYAQLLQDEYIKEIVNGPINDIGIENEYFDIPDDELHYVYDYLNPEISEKRKIKLIGKRRLGNVYKTLRKYGIKPEDYITPFDLAAINEAVQ